MGQRSRLVLGRADALEPVLLRDDALDRVQAVGDLRSRVARPWGARQRREVDIVTGCLLLVPAALWRELGGFDPRYFMYGEDVDLALRAHEAGYRPAITPDAVVTPRDRRLLGESPGEVPARSSGEGDRDRSALVTAATAGRTLAARYRRRRACADRGGHEARSSAGHGRRRGNVAQPWSDRSSWLAGFPASAPDSNSEL